MTTRRSIKEQLLNSDIPTKDIKRLYDGCIKAFASNSLDIKDECWLWQKGRIHSGYGVIQLTHPEIGTGTVDTHRLSWRINNHKLPEGTWYVNHHCDVRRCVNPNHLYLGTPKENAQDRVIRNRSNQSTLTEEHVREIRVLHSFESLTQRRLSELYNVSVKTIADIINYNTWQHVKMLEIGPDFDSKEFYKLVKGQRESAIEFASD